MPVRWCDGCGMLSTIVWIDLYAVGLRLLRWRTDGLVTLICRVMRIMPCIMITRRRCELDLLVILVVLLVLILFILRLVRRLVTRVCLAMGGYLLRLRRGRC